LPSVIMDKIRKEGKDWILAGAKNLAELVGWFFFSLSWGLSPFLLFFGFSQSYVCSSYINIRQALLAPFQNKIK
jgi:hypothetical protein